MHKPVIEQILDRMVFNVLDGACIDVGGAVKDATIVGSAVVDEVLLTVLVKVVTRMLGQH